MPRKRSDVPADYAALLAELKERIAGARLKAALAVNSELILLYPDSLKTRHKVLAKLDERDFIAS